MRLVLRPPVEREIDEAARWYEERQPGLREQFIAAVGGAFARIAGNPRLYPLVHLDIHRASLRRFPYGVYYVLIGEDVHVIAVVHDARHPSVWRRRR
jgi:toxin ParE1/3/4